MDLGILCYRILCDPVQREKKKTYTAVHPSDTYGALYSGRAYPVARDIIYAGFCGICSGTYVCRLFYVPQIKVC